MSLCLPSDTSEWTLYRAYGERRRLLYVGHSRSPGNRMSQHEGHSPWWSLVTSVTFERGYSTEEDVRAAENEAIKTEHPAYNIAIPGERRRYNDLTPRPPRAGQRNCQPGRAYS